MEELRKIISGKDWLHYLESLFVFEGIGTVTYNYKCWQFIEQVTEENYKSLLKDTRGYGAGFFGRKCPHTLFQRPSERVKFFFAQIPTNTLHLQQGTKNFYRIPERDGVNAETYVDDDPRYYDISEGKPIDRADDRPIVSKGSPGVTQYGQFFLQHIISAITDYIIFTTSYSKRFQYADKVCEMIYKQQRSAINHGFFTINWEQSKDEVTVPGDPGDFFNFNDEIYYDPFGDMRTTFIEYTRREPFNNGQERFSSRYYDGLAGRSTTGRLFRGSLGYDLYPQKYDYISASESLPFEGVTNQATDGPEDRRDHTAIPPLRPSWGYLGFIDPPPTFNKQGSDTSPTKAYRAPYPPPFDNYTLDVTKIYDESKIKDRWVKLASDTDGSPVFGGNRNAHCNCWDTSVLAPYLNIEGNE